MQISPELVAAYAPHGNMQMTFVVNSGAPPTQDPETGNYIVDTQNLDYLASVKLSSPKWSPEFGLDPTIYMVTGRLLVPAAFDARITTGIQAEANINGVQGRFDLTYDLDTFSDQVTNNDLRQRFTGIFKIVGGVG